MTINEETKEIAVEDNIAFDESTEDAVNALTALFLIEAAEDAKSTLKKIYSITFKDPETFLLALEKSPAFNRYLSLSLNEKDKKRLIRSMNRSITNDGIRKVRNGFLVFAAGPIAWAVAGTVAGVKKIKNRKQKSLDECREELVRSEAFELAFNILSDSLEKKK